MEKLIQFFPQWDSAVPNRAKLILTGFTVPDLNLGG